MSTKPLVSFIVTVHNEGDMVLEAISSVALQTYKNIEILVVDDGSTDPQTLLELSKIESECNVRVIRQSNLGPSAARNAGISAASGEFFFPLDADDKIEPTFCEKAVTVLLQEPDVGIVYAKGNLFGAENGPWNLPEYTGQSMVLRSLVPACCFYRRTDWEAVGGYCEALVHGLEDYDFNLSILDLGRRVLRLEEPLFWYRKRAGSLSQGHGDRNDLVFTHSTIMRRHQSRYMDNAEDFFKELIELRDEVRDLKFRYSFFEQLRARNSNVYKIAADLRRLINFLKVVRKRPNRISR